MPFQPHVGQEVSIDGVTYSFAEHPAAPGMPYGQEGRRAVVYQLVTGGAERSALKVFKPRFSVPRMVAVAERLRPFGRLPGLQVSERTVLTATRHRETLALHPDLAYAVLMPWVDGATWQEMILSATDPAAPTIAAEDSLRLARGLAEVLVALEERGLAHCDLSGPNLIVGANHRVALVDLEEMYGPGFVLPKILPAGSPGYAHKSAPHGLWNDYADRFAGALLLAEMLGWCDPQVRQAAWGESYFPPEEVQRPGKRYALLQGRLEAHWGRGLADLFARAWNSDSLADCPTFAAWLVTLPTEVPAGAETAPALTAGPAPATPGPADSSGLLILRAQAAADTGDTQGAIALYREAIPGATREMAALIQSRIDTLTERQKRIGAAPAGWLCPNCGQRVSDEMQICPYCEQVPRAAQPPPVTWLCSVCGRSVADDLQVCPFCEGAPLPSQEASPPPGRREPVRDGKADRAQTEAGKPAGRARRRPWPGLAPVLALALAWGFGLVLALVSFSALPAVGAILAALAGGLTLAGTLGLFMIEMDPALPWTRVLPRALAAGAAAGLVVTLLLAFGGHALGLPALMHKVRGLPLAPFTLGAILGTAVMGTVIARCPRSMPGREKRLAGRQFPNHAPAIAIGVLALIVVIVVGSWWSEPLPPAAAQPFAGETVPVPAGPLEMGSRDGDPDEQAVHPVMLDAYRIDRYEVTNYQFADFLNAEDNRVQGFVPWYDSRSDGRHILHVDGHWLVSTGYGEHPVSGVSWYGARAYCAWRGGQLPSEAQWEKAARGTDGRTYPWGEGIDCERANTSECGGEPREVGAFPAGASPYGAQDMAGSMWEWVSDWYDEDYYTILAARSRNPTGPPTGTRKGIRGGSYMSGPSFARSANRLAEFPATRHPSLGFRCVESGVPE